MYSSDYLLNEEHLVQGGHLGISVAAVLKDVKTTFQSVADLTEYLNEFRYMLHIL